ncbi:MAG: FAD-binding oxidoreductase [Gammaproteobacteria bacterium]
MPNKQVIGRLQAIVGPAGFIDEAKELEPFLTEWRGLYRGATPLMLLPSSTGQVSEILRLCSESGVGVVPQGGNTGLAGGAIPGLDGSAEQVLISTSRMNRVRELDQKNYTVTVDAGCILADIQQLVSEYELLFPLSLAAEGSCQIGGNISTNAGGTNVLHYGNTRDLVLGLEVVLPDGRILNELRGLRKDNTGYDLKQLFIGAEGTLGIITAATLKLFPAPVSTATAWLGVADPAAAVRLYALARKQVGDELVAFELMPQLAIDMVAENLPGCRNPLDGVQPWHLLMELANARSQGETEQQLLDFLDRCMQESLVADGIVASSEAQRQALWRVRHGISEAQKKAGASIKHDISVPVSKMPEFLDRAGVLVEQHLPGVMPVPFGHLGDGNLHFNLTQPAAMSSAEFLEHWEPLNRIVHELAVEMGGSFSAEHGIGALKAAELERLASPVRMELMRAIKAAIDPAGIMNPGKVLRER